MTALDGRVAAWASAWQHVQTAAKYRIQVDRALCKAGGDTAAARRVAMQQYHCLMDEARVMAALASVESDVVGMGAGAWLEEDEKRRIEEGLRSRQSFEDLMSPYEKPKDEASDST